MSARRTVERYLQDGDDRQTQRSWFWESDGAHLTLRRCADGDYLLLIGVEDVPQFVADLQELAALSTPKGDTDHER